MKIPANKKLQTICDTFNKRHQKGTHVIVQLDSGERKETVTTTIASVLSGHTPVIWLEGVSGCYALDHVIYNPGNSKESANPPSAIDLNREKIAKELIGSDVDHEFIKGCLILRGSIPIRTLRVTRLCGKEDVIGTKYHSNAEANMIIGSLENLTVMAESPEFKSMCKARWAAKINKLHGSDDQFYETLPENVRNWFELGEHGASSHTLLNVTLAKELGFYNEDDYTDDYPLDIYDFNRCKKLVETVPEIREHFSKVAKLSAEWKFAITHFDEYAALIDDASAKDHSLDDLKAQYKQSRKAVSPNRLR